MQIIVYASGDVSFETDNVEQAAELVHRLRDKYYTTAKQKTAPKQKKAPEPKVETTPLSPQLLDTWVWLSGRDGATIPEAAKELGIKEATAGYRLRNLAQKELVRREGKAYFVQGAVEE